MPPRPEFRIYGSRAIQPHYSISLMHQHWTKVDRGWILQAFRLPLPSDSAGRRGRHRRPIPSRPPRATGRHRQAPDMDDGSAATPQEGPPSASPPDALATSTSLLVTRSMKTGEPSRHDREPPPQSRHGPPGRPDHRTTVVVAWALLEQEGHVAPCGRRTRARRQAVPHRAIRRGGPGPALLSRCG